MPKKQFSEVTGEFRGGLYPDGFYDGFRTAITEMCISLDAKIIDLQPEQHFVAYMLQDPTEVKCFGNYDLVKLFKKWMQEECGLEEAREDLLHE